MQADNPYAGQNQYTGEFGNNTFGGGATATNMGTPLLMVLLLLVLLILLVRRKFILCPLMFGLFLLPFGQTLVILGFHLYASRILIATAFARVLATRSPDKPLLGAGFNSLDKLFIIWAIVRATAFILQHRQMGAVYNQLGFFWDALGGYFLMRFLIQDDDDCLQVIKVLSSIAAILGVTLLYEHLHGVNLYEVLNGKPIFTDIRNGSYRAKGPFHHAILAGTFLATLFPLFVWLWKSKALRFMALVSLFASLLGIFSTASSTPIGSLLAGMGAIFTWPMRRNMRMIRWGIVVGLILLNFAMHASIWWALMHIDFAGGSAGQHRAELIDSFVNHFGEWWLIGTKDNANWGFEMWDTSNQYLKEAQVGGLAAVICFLGMLYVGYRWIGIARNANADDHQKELYLWFLGAALFSHTVGFFGICYFDQTGFSWYALLAIICTATAPYICRKPSYTALPPSERSDALFFSPASRPKLVEKPCTRISGKYERFQY
jgi:hypothetical protein